MPRIAAVPGKQRAPLDELTAGFVQHPVADPTDQATALGDRDELRGRDRAALGVIPPNQCLHAHDGLVTQRDDGLVFEPELAPLKRLPKFPADGVPRDRAITKAGVEELVVIAATFLRLVHRGVGVSNDVLATRVGVAGDDDTDARRDVQLDTFTEERFANGPHDSISDDTYVLVGGQPVAQQHELVTTEPRNGVEATRDRGKPRTDLDQ